MHLDLAPCAHVMDKNYLTRLTNAKALQSGSRVKPTDLNQWVGEGWTVSNKNGDPFAIMFIF
jgi:hypothetical protein